MRRQPPPVPRSAMTGTPALLSASMSRRIVRCEHSRREASVSAVIRPFAWSNRTIEIRRSARMVRTVHLNHDITCHEGATIVAATLRRHHMEITAYLLYRDAGAAVDWLAKAFGLRPNEVLKGADGRVNHAVMRFGDAVLMLGSPGPDFQGPRALGHATHNLYVDVDDVEKHYARAVA